MHWVGGEGSSEKLPFSGGESYKTAQEVVFVVLGSPA